MEKYQTWSRRMEVGVADATRVVAGGEHGRRWDGGGSAVWDGGGQASLP